MAYFEKQDYMAVEDYPPGTFSVNGLDAYTFSAWCRPTEQNAGSLSKIIAAYWQSEQFGYADWILGLGGTNRMQVFAGWTLGNTDGYFLSDPVERTVGSLLYCVCTWEKTGMSSGGGPIGTAKLYVNGECVVSMDDAPPGGQRVGANLAVGGYHYPNSGAFIGEVRHVKLYHGALTAQQIRERWQVGPDYMWGPDY